MGFGDKWRFWISICISSTSFSILLNGMSYGFLKGQRGLRQGGPLSPFLFNIVMEVFSMLILRAKEVRCHDECKIEPKGPSVGLLQFADNSLLFIPNSIEELCNLCAILLMFEVSSGIKVNLPMCKLLPVGSVPNLLILDRILGCAIESCP